MYKDVRSYKLTILNKGVDKLSVSIADDDTVVERGIELETHITMLVKHHRGAVTIGNGIRDMQRANGIGRNGHKGTRKKSEDFLHEWRILKKWVEK